MTGLSKLVEWCEKKLSKNKTYQCGQCRKEMLDKARAMLAEEQANKPVEDEPLEELAKRKNKIVNKPIVICERAFFNERVFYKESEARAYLNGLDDKGDK